MQAFLSVAIYVVLAYILAAGVLSLLFLAMNTRTTNARTLLSISPMACAITCGLLAMGVTYWIGRLIGTQLG